MGKARALVSKAEDKVPKRKPETTPLMWAHPKPHTKHKHNRKTRRIHQRLYRKGKLITTFLLHILSTQNSTNPKGKAGNRPDLEKNQPMGQIFLTSLNLSYIISFLFSFFHQIFYRKAQSMPNIRGRNGTERGREDTIVPFLVLKYFTSPLFLFLPISPLLWSG